MNLGTPSAHLDEETGLVTLTFSNTAEADDPNPVAFTSTKIVTVALSGEATITDLSAITEQPEG